MSARDGRLNNRQLIAEVKKLLGDAYIGVISHRIRQHPDFEHDYRPTRFIKLAAVAPAPQRRALTRKINRFIWAKHEGPVWYGATWRGTLFTMTLGKHGD